MLHIEVNRIHSDVFVQNGIHGIQELSVVDVKSAFPYFIPKTNNIWTYRSTLDEKKYDELCKHVLCLENNPYTLHDVIYHPHKTFDKSPNELPVNVVLPYLKAGLTYARLNETTLKFYVHGSTLDYTKFINWLELFIMKCESEQEEAFLSVEHVDTYTGNLP